MRRSPDSRDCESRAEERTLSRALWLDRRENRQPLFLGCCSPMGCLADPDARPWPTDARVDMIRTPSDLSSRRRCEAAPTRWIAIERRRLAVELSFFALSLFFSSSPNLIMAIFSAGRKKSGLASSTYSTGQGHAASLTGGGARG